MCHGNIHDHYSEEGWPSEKTKNTLETTKHDSGDQTEKTPVMRSLSSKRDTKRSLKQFKKKLKPQTKN